MVGSGVASADEKGFFAELGDDFLDVASSPFEVKLEDLFYLLPAVGVTWIVAHNDGWFREQAQDSRRYNLDRASSVIGSLGDGWVQLSGCALVMAVGGERERKVGRRSIRAFIVSGATVQLIKSVCGRERPGASPDDPYVFHGPSWEHHSFPSGHSITAFAIATVIADEYECGWFSYPIAALVALSRVYDDAHWASDVLVGSLLGHLVGSCVSGVESRDSGLTEVTILRFSI